MVLKNSTMLPLGTLLPDFSLQDTDGEYVSAGDFLDAKAVLIMFICNHCPYVVHVRDEIQRIAEAYQSQGVAVVGISSNSIQTHPQDGPEKMKDEKAAAGYTFPYLYDETQEVAKTFKAACTPDFYVFDGEQKLTYRGQFDNSRPGNDLAVTGADLCAALDAALAGKELMEEQRPSAGCNIKWHPGNEPDYF